MNGLDIRINDVRILTISLNAWNDTMATGNTFSNLFKGIPASNIFNIYCRNEVVHNSICKKYFRITEKDMIRSVFGNKECGKEFDNLEDHPDQDKRPSATNRTVFRHMRDVRPAIFLMVRELIWDTKKWANEELDKFLLNCRPDVIYMHAHNNLYMHKILDYCRLKTNAKLVLFFGDDMYNHKSYMPMQILYQNMLNSWLRNSVRNAGLLFGGTQELCKEYAGIFDREFNVLYKSCNLSGCVVKSTVNDPIRMVYAGNLLYRRDKVLVELAKRIKTANSTGERKIELEVYTATDIKHKYRSILNSDNIYLFGSKPYSEICDIMQKADIVLHVESNKKKQQRITRLSFSTKIIDCMQCGSAMFAVGPQDIASIRYIKSTNSAIVAYSYDEIAQVIERIQNHPDIILKYAERMHYYAMKNHDSDNLRAQFLNHIVQLMKGSST